MKYKIYNQDVIKWAKEYQKGKFHAMFCDAPYHLTSIVKRFGKKNSAPAKHGTDGVFSRSSKGFMGQQWDGGDIAFRPETWEALGEHLYPGAFGMAFSASRNWHRMAVAIEDAGMIIHPTIFGWLNGQGFPKASNISKRLDRNAGVEMKSVPATGVGMFNKAKGGGGRAYNRTDGGYNETKNRLIQVGESTDDSKIWEGHRYGLQALKPAVEPIIVFQKPYEGKPLDNIVETGAGALNIDGARIPLATDDEYTINTFDDGAKPWGNGAGHKYTSRKVKEDKRLGGNGTWKTDKAAKNVYEGGYEGVDVASSPLGRWPANFILDESVAERLDAQSGERPTGEVHRRVGMGYHGSDVVQENIIANGGDTGGASRFFFNVQEQIDEADPIYYCGKVSPKERNAGLDERCTHPTLKPIALAKYLATLLLPPEAYAPRRILVPFSGVGSELIGCALAGWEHIVGIEFDTENGYVEIAHKRMEHWTK